MNKKLKTALAAILALCSLTSLSGCAEKQLQSSDPAAGYQDRNSSDSSINNSSDNGNNSDISDNTNNSDNSENKDTEKTETVKTAYSPIALTDNNTLNSIRLFDAVSADKSNSMFSPVSLNMALGLLEAGAGGVTGTELDSYLQTENFTDFAENYMKLARERYTHEDEYDGWKNVLEIANSLWADNALPLKDEYKKTMTGRLGAEIKNVSFADKENTIGKINGWVSEKTHKLIPKTLEDYNDDTAAMLINTVYFESAWLYKWRTDSSPEPFTLSDGTKKNIPLMYNGNGSGYYENDKAAAFGLSYLNGMQFIGILPNETGEFTLESLDIPSLLESKSYKYDVTAVMPKLEFESEFAPVEPLKAAGLESLFDADRADLSGISDAPLFVSDVFQKTKLELDENGTKAAAVTVMTFTNTGIPQPKERKTVRLDRPFAFMIYDENEDQILFIGKVADP